MGTLLCGVDGSEHATRAVDLAAGLARSLGADLALVAVNTPMSASGGGVMHTWSDIEAEAILDAAARQARRQGVRARRILASDRDAPAAILACADEIGADHIIVGAGASSLLGRLLLGSVAQAIAVRARCTVTLAR